MQLTTVSIFYKYDDMLRRPSSSRSPALTAGTLALALLALPGCAAITGAGEDEDGRVEVMTSFYPMQFLAERIGGRHLTVDTLTKPGAEPHDLELSPRQTGELSEAEVVVYVQGLQPAVDEAIEQSGVPHVVEATSLAGHDHETHPREGAGHNHEDDEAHQGDEGHQGDGDGGDDDGHDHGATDPHLWLDPVRYAKVAKGVGAALREADPDHAADYRENTASLVKQLQALDEEFSRGLADAAGRTFLTSHAAFGHLAERYGLREESVAGLDPESEVSAARMRDLHRLVARQKITTVFTEPLTGDRAARALADDLDLRTDVLDPLEGITDASPGSDYFQVMRANLAALRTAFGIR